MTPADITVVIPALNEEQAIGRSVHSAVSAGATEVIVSDGGSGDHTVERAAEAGASSVVRSLPGRGVQMNSAAHLASGIFILFLHADNELSEQALSQICVHEDAVWGAFQQQIDSRRRVYRLIEWGNDLRVRWRKVPFGDQGMFVRRTLFEELGGFAEIPLMEDVELSHRLRKIEAPVLLRGPLQISARRWETKGVVRQTLTNWMIQLSYTR
ncbi:TIGR04283 family arsenosugar biosynthesis glycosyltransferase, partial [Rubripirellula sp.]|nr:TIGR04283 family arsenosugar biosynthesis glycosyltransferase [Rubripirellula sp.]